MSPIVMRIDEIEKQLSGSGGALDGGVSTKVLGGLLTWMQESTSPVFRIATANRVESLPPELLRKGRFDEIFFLDLPDEDERLSIFDYHLTKRVKEINWTVHFNHSNCQDLLNMTKGWSGAEIEQVVIQSLRKHEKVVISGHEIMYTVESEAEKTVPLSVIRKEDIDKIRNWAVDNGCRMASENKELQQRQEQNRNGRRIMIN